MGREVRMVPPNWQHPLKEKANDDRDFQPLHDERYADAAVQWKEGFSKWESGLRPQYEDGETVWVPKSEWRNADIYTEPDLEFWEYKSAPPEGRDCYRPYSDEEATWFQAYETVSEGTPVSPPFATKEELVDYLAEFGDFWDQSRIAKDKMNFKWVYGRDKAGWGREAAERFVGHGHAMSMMVVATPSGAKMYSPSDKEMYPD